MRPSFRGAFTLLGLAVTAALTAGCTDETAPNSTDPTATSIASGVDCVAVREACETVNIDGRTYRYSLTSGDGAQQFRGGSKSVVLFDLGGPGKALFGTGEATYIASQWQGPERLLFLEEPWVTQEVTGNCAESLRLFYRGLHDATSLPASKVAEACRLQERGKWGWSPSNYRGVVEAILEKEKLDLVGVVGASFGAPRVRALMETLNVEWAIFNSPAPYGLDGDEYVDSRAAAAVQVAQEACHECKEPNGVERLIDSTQVALRESPIELETRTPLLTSTDVAAATIGSAYLSKGDRAEFISELARFGPKGADLVAEISDSTLLRFGAEDMSPAILAYFDEVCRSYAPWESVDGRDDSVAGTLGRLHAPCRSVTTTGPHSTQQRGEVVVPTCLIYSESDGVTPPQFVMPWRHSLGSEGTVLLESESGHASLDMTLRCYRTLVLDQEGESLNSSAGAGRVLD
ncbi:hypothetical protein [Kineococcus glutinatus]|uniref:TAP-like protein n=1 Tax=Kineococcus glutinatus TaxID=1070872 RepID=A0ABP9HGN7_9ACTN